MRQPLDKQPDTLKLGISPCPNDTFAFYALLHNLIDIGIKFDTVIKDVEALNKSVMNRELDISKVSFHAFAYVSDRYVLLPVGSALGRGCGPLLISKGIKSPNDLVNRTIAIPGKWTTASLLLRLFLPDATNLKVMHFSAIPDAVALGEVDAGVIIHESRFTYMSKGLVCVQDLGSWWEDISGLPIPLGGIIANREIPRDILYSISDAIGSSIKYAMAHPDHTRDFIKSLSQELDDEVIDNHINLYVNDFTLNLSEEGRRALLALFSMGREKSVLPSNCNGDLFL